jgi:D-sedoheptulose 7-phosphate isomerase
MKINESLSERVITNYLGELSLAFKEFPQNELTILAARILSTVPNGSIFVAGNGGSATTASHMATDLGVGSLRRQNPVRCISLVDNAGVITATSNDIDFASIFSQQLKLLAKPDDILICFSASGNSENLVQAVKTAKDMDLFTVGITGFDGGKLKQLCDLSIHFPTNIGSYGVVEDIHSTVSHVVTEIIRAS